MENTRNKNTTKEQQHTHTKKRRMQTVDVTNTSISFSEISEISVFFDFLNLSISKYIAWYDFKIQLL